MSAPEEPRPVSDRENKEVDGNALCAARLWEDHTVKVAALRERQAQYLETLPREPEAARQAIRRLLHPGGKSYPDGFERALHLVTAIEELARHGDFDVIGTQESLAYLAEWAVGGLRDTKDSLDRISDVLMRAAMVERPKDG